MSKREKQQITEKHFLDFSDIASLGGSINVYGKLLRNTTFPSQPNGVTHPTDPKGTIQMALLVGYSEQGRCVSLGKPQLTAMPAPTGPADGCGWDPSEYVVWKDQSKQWVTLHLSASAKSLYSVLASSSPQPAEDKIIPADQVVSVFQDCIAHVTGNTTKVDLGKSLQNYGFDTQHQVDTFSGFVIGSSDFGVPHYGFSLPGDALNWVTNTTQLGGLLNFIQNAAVPK
jgi:hypothetical protein